MKVCIVAIAKNENLYINEWIEHHLNIGFDHIYICDNNNENGERISDVVNNEKVTIINYIGFKGIQPIAYTNCFIKYRSECDWIAFIDIDEFIILDNKYKSIKDFISDPMFKEASIIRLHWKVFSGGTELEANENYRVIDRFLERYPCKEEKWAKSIIKTNIRINHRFHGHGYYDKDLVALNAIGEHCLNNDSAAGEIPIHKNAWINHYPTKTIGEYIDQKYWRGGPNRNDKTYSNLEHFFKYNPENETLRQYGLDKIKKGAS